MAATAAPFNLSGVKQKLPMLGGDALDVLPKISATSVQLVVADPPYFRVAAATWDRQWADADEYVS